MDLLERSMDLSVTSGGHAARAHRLEGSFTLDQHDDDARANSFAFSSAPAGTGLNTSGISMIEDDDEEDGEDGNDDTRGIMGHATDPHTRATFSATCTSASSNVDDDAIVVVCVDEISTGRRGRCRVPAAPGGAARVDRVTNAVPRDTGICTSSNTTPSTTRTRSECRGPPTISAHTTFNPGTSASVGISPSLSPSVDSMVTGPPTSNHPTVNWPVIR